MAFYSFISLPFLTRFLLLNSDYHSSQANSDQLLDSILTKFLIKHINFTLCSRNYLHHQAPKCFSQGGTNSYVGKEQLKSFDQREHQSQNCHKKLVKIAAFSCKMEMPMEPPRVIERLNRLNKRIF